MKKLLPLILAAMMLLGVAACGTTVEPHQPDEDAPPAVTEPQDAEPAEPDADAEQGAEPTEPQQPDADASQSVEPQAPAEDQPAPVSADKATASGYVGSDVSALYAAIGRPASSDYAPSCLGTGEDGNLYYDGFTVYTYRESGSEIIQYVE